MDLEMLRNEINGIDDELVSLFEKRMNVASEIGKFKADNKIPVLNSAREREVLKSVIDKADGDMKQYVSVLYSLLFELSRAYQEKLVADKTELYSQIDDAINNTEKLFPQNATVACQGTEGSYSQSACNKVFKNPNVVFMKTFENVFSAIESGLCKYGILPIENSTAGSVNKVYDLMISRNFYIVKSTRVKVNHCLLAKNGAKLSEIKEIYSHEQAIAQCSDFLNTLEGVKIIPCENTATAAAMVSQSDNNSIAAISSYECASLYGLECINSDIQNNGNNYTRFICISKKLEIYPGADKTSIMLVLPHKPGSLYKVLSRFFALGINLIKLESRPMTNRDFEFMFYFDLETSIYSQEFIQLICELDGICDKFKYLGSYSEVI